ncbi:MAG: hypothetical protein LBH14_06740 [Desulfobulbaceae bacterium]|jgi:hypothetical protein|nr:hypothetical protein [Desulfobulbaceae bacterium]
MALPKAVLCILGDEPADYAAEAELRAVGFATFSITWKELNAQENGWIQILPPLDDPTVVAWVLAGKTGDFTDEVRAKVALLTLAMQRNCPPVTAFVLTEEGDIADVPYAMNHIQIYRHTRKYAVKLMVAKAKPQPFTALPFHAQAHLDPLIGAWLEIAPPAGVTWPGFMAGVTNAEISAFGVGPRGVLPVKSTLQFPMLGIKGELGEKPFSACAAKNTLSDGASCYMRLNGTPGLVFCAEYPDEDKPEQHSGRSPVQLEFV